MANRKSGGTAAKVIAWILALVLVAGIVAGVVLWQKDYIQLNFPTGEQTEETPDEDDQGGLVVEDGEAAGMTLTRSLLSASEYEEYGISPLAETAYTLTATVTPAEATDQSIEWSVEFVNPSSAWATGKTVTDYVTVTPSGENNQTAAVACVGAFGEQIKITAASGADSTKKAECLADYGQRIKTIKYFDYGNPYGVDLSTASDIVWNYNLTQALNAYFEIEYYDYTLADSALSNLNADALSIYSEATETPSGISVHPGFMTLDKTSTNKCSANLATCLNISNTTAVNNWIATHADGSGNVRFISIKVDIDGTYSDFSAEVPYRFNSATFYTAVTDVSLDEDGLVF